MLLKDLLHAKILIVDDDVANIELLTSILQFAGFTHLQGISDPRGVLSRFVEFEPDLIVLDLSMPYFTGHELLTMMKPMIHEVDYVPVLVVTGEHSFEARHKALANGASDLLTKPYIPEEVVVRISNMLRLRFRSVDLQKQVQQRTHELEQYQLELKEAQLETICRLARAAEHRDDETGRHTQRVGLICAMIAQSLGWTGHQVELIHFAAPLHDVGKIGVPDSVLLKPGKYTEVEHKVMQRHCLIGGELLSGGRSDTIRMAERIACMHHEKWNGEGYPRGLQKDEIDIEGRIVAVADVFDALTHDRPYKKAWPVEEAVTEISAQSGRHFDPEIVEAFLTLPHNDLAKVSLNGKASGNLNGAQIVGSSVNGADLKSQPIVT